MNLAVLFGVLALILAFVLLSPVWVKAVGAWLVVKHIVAMLCVCFAWDSLKGLIGR